MTVGLGRWLRLLAAPFTSIAAPGRRPQRLDALVLGERALADLNLPDDIAAGLRSRRAAEEMRRSFATR